MAKFDLLFVAHSSVLVAMGCSGWFTPVVRTSGELLAALQRARGETHPSYIEVRLEHKLVTAMSRPAFERQHQISQPSSEVWRPVVGEL